MLQRKKIMNITLNTSTTDNTNCRKPNFGAQLRGSAIRGAIKEAKDINEMFEVAEILENVKQFGDKKTIISCGFDGLVTVSNGRFSEIVVNKFKLNRNDQAPNPFLDLLKVFNTENRIIKLEHDLFDSIFAHTKGLEAKKSKYKLYSSYDLPVTTRAVLDNSARNNGLLPGSEKLMISKQEKLEKFNKLKAQLLANFQKSF